MVISVHTGCCVCISSAGRQCPGAGSGLPSSTDGGGACQFVEPRARASCWALRHLMKTQMATRMMTRAITAKMTAHVMRDSRLLRGWPPPFLPPPPVFSSGVGSGP